MRKATKRRVFLAVITTGLFICARCFAVAERENKAIGGEIFVLLVPYAVSTITKEIRDMYFL